MKGHSGACRGDPRFSEPDKNQITRRATTPRRRKAVRGPGKPRAGNLEAAARPGSARPIGQDERGCLCSHEAAARPTHYRPGPNRAAWKGPEVRGRRLPGRKFMCQARAGSPLIRRTAVSADSISSPWPLGAISGRQCPWPAVSWGRSAHSWAWRSKLASKLNLIGGTRQRP